MIDSVGSSLSGEPEIPCNIEMHQATLKQSTARQDRNIQDNEMMLLRKILDEIDVDRNVKTEAWMIGRTDTDKLQSIGRKQ